MWVLLKLFKTEMRRDKNEHTCCVCEPEGYRLVLDGAHVTDRHLACVIGEIFGPQIFELQHFGLTLKKKRKSDTLKKL